jgi:hypothetical protein
MKTPLTPLEPPFVEKPLAPPITNEHTFWQTQRLRSTVGKTVRRLTRVDMLIAATYIDVNR